MCVDARVFSNIARFANNNWASPKLELAWHALSMDTSNPRCFLMATKDIAAGDELCYDYGPHYHCHWERESREEGEDGKEEGDEGEGREGEEEGKEEDSEEKEGDHEQKETEGEGGEAAPSRRSAEVGQPRSEQARAGTDSDQISVR